MKAVSIVCSASLQRKRRGRIHTSAATVAVLPEADENRHQNSKPRISASIPSALPAPGGQSVKHNIFRRAHHPLAHGPRGLSTDEKSQIKKPREGHARLRSRLYEMEPKKQQAAIGLNGRGQIKTGDRSEKIRTYNLSPNRVHRPSHRPDHPPVTEVMDGKLALWSMASSNTTKPPPKARIAEA